jgi:hypothetical protein
MKRKHSISDSSGHSVSIDCPDVLMEMGTRKMRRGTYFVRAGGELLNGIQNDACSPVAKPERKPIEAYGEDTHWTCGP